MIGDLIRQAISPILEGVLRLIPDKAARAAARERFEVDMLTAMTSLVAGQLAINQTEAQHKSLFVAGWRPGVGWICALALGWNFLAQPIITWGFVISGHSIAEAPQLETGELTTILLGMLGLGGLRTYEKRLGVASNNMGPKEPDT